MSTSNCSQHKKEVAGISDMKELAEMIGDLHYETFQSFLYLLGQKVWRDAKKDEASGHNKIAIKLGQASNFIDSASIKIKQAWVISKPFMESNKPQDK